MKVNQKAIENNMDARNTKPPLKVNQTMGRLEWGLIALLSLLWGGSFFFVGVAVMDGRWKKAV